MGRPDGARRRARHASWRTASRRPSGCGCSGRTRRSEHAERPPPPPPPSSEDKAVGELVIDVSERTSTLIREEIELAKTEVREKIRSCCRARSSGIAAGVFVLMALAMFMHGSRGSSTTCFSPATSRPAS